uniref:Uncharacterized protein n=1 Tax=Caulerpa lentillifera TaxID=148947 RepID=A0A2Z2QKH6_9CHLO|nr:hypothetical protein [Caulerpa lentillifera]AST24246.1 hypothetical protein [Caulerpa lentillifera]
MTLPSEQNHGPVSYFSACTLPFSIIPLYHLLCVFSTFILNSLLRPTKGKGNCAKAKAKRGFIHAHAYKLNPKAFKKKNDQAKISTCFGHTAVTASPYCANNLLARKASFPSYGRKALL